MIRRLLLVLSLAAVAGCTAVAASPPPAGNGVEFSGKESVVDLGQSLEPFKGPPGAQSRDEAWYTFTAVNTAKEPAIRVLQAAQPPGISLSILPRATRPAIRQVVSTAAGVTIESSNAYGRHGFRVTIPASTTASLAVRVQGADTPPTLLAWTEPSLAARNRQMAIFIAAVGGLIAAAAAIAGGLAVMTHHAPPRWAALTLLLLLLTRLTAIGMFDGSLVTDVGGPFGLAALFEGLTLAAALRFLNEIVPLKETWPKAPQILHWVIYALVAVSALAYLGIPGATPLVEIVMILAAVLIAGFVYWRGRNGSRPAQVVTPSAAMFALSGILAAAVALGAFGEAPWTPDLAGSFAAAGAVLLALAVTAGEGIALIHLSRHGHPAPPAERAPQRPAEPAVHRAAIEAIGASYQGVFELDFRSNTVILSREGAALVGVAELRLPHQAWIARLHPEDRAVYQQAVSEYGGSPGLAFRVEFRVATEDGRYPWFELRATMKGPENGRVERCVGLLADVTIRKEADADMIDRSLRDPLTGLGNRVALMDELERLGERLRGAVFALLDIDRFKAIHASLGDEGGDTVLSKLGQRLTQRFFGFARVFRVGGDAFAILVQQPEGDPVKVGSELVGVCGEPHVLEGRNVFAPVSVGVADGSTARDPIELLKNAELALAQAKRQGGDCAKVYTQELESFAPADVVTLETELRHALEEGEIEVFYQPIMRLADRTVAGFEALLRWRHPVKGLVSPGDFIAHSEESGLIVGLGRFALERAARDLAQWQRFFPLPDPLFVSVNLSRRQFRDQGLIGHIRGLLADAGLAPKTLKLEVTESAIASDPEVRGSMDRMRELGAGLAIDDFGTGLSSLSQLADLPFDAVKVDKSFLARHGGTDSETDGDVVLASIVSLAHNLKRSVIIEGVETEEDAARVAELGCEFAQGFLFSEPLAMQDALRYIARRFRAADAHRSSGAAGFG